MEITLRTFAAYGEIIGSREMALTLPHGETIAGLIETLCRAHPGLRERLFDASGTFKSYNIILKNGRSVASLRQLDTVIDEGDVIALFPPVAGG